MAHVCAELAKGRSTRQVCREDPGMPDEATVRLWAQEEQFAPQYARARAALMEFWADEIVTLADESERDTLVDEDGRERQNTEWLQRSRLRVDTRKWLMSKLSPKRYGDRLELAGDPEAPLALVVRREEKR